MDIYKDNQRLQQIAFLKGAVNNKEFSSTLSDTDIESFLQNIPFEIMKMYLNLGFRFNDHPWHILSVFSEAASDVQNLLCRGPVSSNPYFVKYGLYLDPEQLADNPADRAVSFLEEEDIKNALDFEFTSKEFVLWAEKHLNWPLKTA